MGSEITVIDPVGRTGEMCSCGKEAMFILSVNNNYNHLCEVCLGELGKSIINALV